MRRRLMPYILVAIISAALTTLLQPFDHLRALAQGPGQAAQQTASRCQTFPETGKTVCGRFLEYWRQNGGLPQQGYPLTDTFTEVSDLDGKPYTVQYFERAVFELHPENRPPHDVLLSQLGTFRYRDKYPNGAPAPQPTSTATGTGAITGRLGFPSEVIPPMSVFAIEVAGRGYYSTTTRMNQLSYTIAGIPAGIYYVVGYLEGNADSAGAYSQFVLCGIGATCNDHSLVPVQVKAGETTGGADVMDWYALPNTFPTRPDLPPLGNGYMWPRQIPPGQTVHKESSWASETSFVLTLVQSGGRFSSTITGGPSSIANSRPSQRTIPVTVRGQQGILYEVGPGFNLYWTEGGQPYSIMGLLGRAEVISLAESLQLMDLATWRARLEAAR